MQPFLCSGATDVAAAVAMVGGDPGAQFFAGGTSQVDLMKEGVQRPTRLVDVSDLGLDEITAPPGGGLRVGASPGPPSGPLVRPAGEGR